MMPAANASDVLVDGGGGSLCLFHASVIPWNRIRGVSAFYPLKTPLKKIKLKKKKKKTMEWRQTMTEE